MSYKILVVSDSHRRTAGLEKALKNMSGHMDMMIHLGDSELSPEFIRGLTDKPVVMVRGNCDFYGGLPETEIVDLGVHKLFVTHGHRYSCKAGHDMLVRSAMENGADVVMYGHTHVPYLGEESGIMVLNPGSIEEPRQYDRKKSYLVMTIEDGGRTEYMHVYL